MTAAIAKNELEMLLNMSVQNGYQISDLLRKDTILKGNSAYYISYTETDQKNQHKNFVFNSFAVKDKSLVLSTSGDLDGGKYVDKFKKIFYVIKM